MRSTLYKLAKLMGDIKAVTKGPEAIQKRIVRRLVGKMTSRILWGKLFR